MRTSDIAYVPNGPVHYYPAKELEEMTLDEIVKKYLRTCAKSNGEIAACSRCKSPCKEGKRAIQLLANQVYSDPPIPLYGGKTLIERAKEENMKRREAMKNEAVNVNKENVDILAEALTNAKKEALGEKTEVKEEKKPKKKRTEWWEPSLESGDQVKWLMENLGVSKTNAKKKIYQYKYTHGMLKEQPVKKPEPEKVEDAPVEAKPVESTIESKLEALMREQEECRKEMAKYQDLFNKAQEKYNAIRRKTDILCSAMDILND